MVRLIPAILVLLIWSSAVTARSGAEQMRLFLDDLVTLEAEFKQAILNADQDRSLSSEGMFFLQRPGRFRWDYQMPNGQMVIADGNTVWLIDKELEQVSHQGQEIALRGTPALLLSDTAPLEQHFVVTDIGARNDMAWVELQPKDTESEFTRILLAFSDNQLRQMEMTDNFGQITRFQFANIKRNQPLSIDLFQYRPPPGFDVIGK